MSHRQWIAALAFGCATLSGAAFAQAPPAEQAPVGSGPYPALMEAAPGLPTHTLYRPADLSALGDQQLPIVVWGNGACANAGNSFRAFLTELASYGYFIVANGPIDPEWPNSQQRPVIRPDGVRELPPPATRSSQLIEAIDWAFAQASRRNGDFRGRLDTSEVAVMGMSCGGVQALEASADRRVTTTMIWNSGMPERGTSMAGGAHSPRTISICCTRRSPTSSAIIRIRPSQTRRMISSASICRYSLAGCAACLMGAPIASPMAGVCRRSDRMAELANQR